MAEVCQAVAHGSLMGARGNSGVILSQVLRGLADTFRTIESAGAHEIVVGLRQASDAAYEAVMRPVEGTILTVVRASAEAAEKARDAGEQALVGVLDAALDAARDAVLHTPDLLPVLKEAGVVDAGGRGFTLLLDAFLEVVAGRPIPEPEFVDTPVAVEAHLAGDDVASLRYEVMYLLEAEDSTIDAFKQTWAALGDSIVVVGGEGLWNCHVHTDDIGGAIEAGIEAGRPRQLRVTDLLEQVEEEQWVREQDASLARAGEPDDATDRPTAATAVVAVGVGEGIRRLLVSLGVHEIVAGGQSMNPSTAQILEAVERCPSDAVVVLPNNKNIVPVARQVDGLTSRRVEVIPTTSVVEALAALVAYDPQAAVDDNVEAMNEAASRVAAGEVTQAVRDSVAECGPISDGDWLAIRRDGICATAANPVDAALALVDGPGHRGQRDRDRARRCGGPRRGHRAGPRAGGAGALASGGRGARGRPAALPVPDRGGVATAPRTLRELDATPLGDVEGIAAKLLERLAMMTPPIESVLDLLQHYPRRYHDRTRKAEIAELVQGEEATIVAEVKRVSSRPTRQRKKMVEAVVEDETGLLNLVFFNQPWRERQLAVGTEVALYGKLDIFRGKRQLANPIVDVLGRAGDAKTGVVMPIYPQSGKADVSTWEIQRAVASGARLRGPARRSAVGRPARRAQAPPRTDVVVPQRAPARDREGLARGPAPAAVRRVPADPDPAGGAQAHDRGRARRHRARGRRRAAHAVPRLAALRADRGPARRPRRDPARPREPGADAPAAAGRGRLGEDRRRGRGAAHRGPGRLPGRARWPRPRCSRSSSRPWRARCSTG